MRKNKAHLESLYAKKWQEIREGSKNTYAYKRLKAILSNGVNRLRIDYGHFWRVKK